MSISVCQAQGMGQVFKDLAAEAWLAQTPMLCHPFGMTNPCWLLDNQPVSSYSWASSPAVPLPRQWSILLVIHHISWVWVLTVLYSCVTWVKFLNFWISVSSSIKWAYLDVRGWLEGGNNACGVLTTEAGTANSSCFHYWFKYAFTLHFLLFEALLKGCCLSKGFSDASQTDHSFCKCLLYSVTLPHSYSLGTWHCAIL